ncbi:MAG: hypothetical protein PHY16_15615 [Methylobacter sp.]|nr:hypothetical protein [Methylobacter sp.]
MPEQPWKIIIKIIAVQKIQAFNPAADTTFIFHDSAFADDVTKTNLAAIDVLVKAQGGGR